jgi:hypothetical protein
LTKSFPPFQKPKVEKDKNQNVKCWKCEMWKTQNVKMLNLSKVEFVKMWICENVNLLKRWIGGWIKKRQLVFHTRKKISHTHTQITQKISRALKAGRLA